MTRLLIPSDYLSIRSDGHSGSIRLSSAKTAPQTAARFAATRPRVARLVDRDLQAVRSAELPRDGPGHGPKRYLVISQPGGRPHREYVPNATCDQVTQWLGNFRRLRDAFNEICAINAELLRRREDLE